jgi:predicted nuclease with TOPRIM domain
MSGRENQIRRAFGMDDEFEVYEEVVYESRAHQRLSDDGMDVMTLSAHVARLMDTVTRVGGEVCRLRAEMDGLLDHNKELATRFERLREVIEEKGSVDMDDFELACEVMNARQAAAVPSDALLPVDSKKLTH